MQSSKKVSLRCFWFLRYCWHYVLLAFEVGTEMQKTFITQKQNISKLVGLGFFSSCSLKELPRRLFMLELVQYTRKYCLSTYKKLFEKQIILKEHLLSLIAFWNAPSCKIIINII